MKIECPDELLRKFCKVSLRLKFLKFSPFIFYTIFVLISPLKIQAQGLQKMLPKASGQQVCAASREELEKKAPLSKLLISQLMTKGKKTNAGVSISLPASGGGSKNIDAGCIMNLKACEKGGASDSGKILVLNDGRFQINVKNQKQKLTICMDSAGVFPVQLNFNFKTPIRTLKFSTVLRLASDKKGSERISILTRATALDDRKDTIIYSRGSVNVQEFLGSTGAASTAASERSKIKSRAVAAQMEQ